MNTDNIIDLESKAKDLLSTIQSIKNNPFSNLEEMDENYTIEGFHKHIQGLQTFVKSMRVYGFLGESPQKEEDLDMQFTISQQLSEIKNFVEDVYTKYK